MNSLLTFGWLSCFITAYIIQILFPITVDSIEDINNIDRNKVYLAIVAGILSLIGFILFIVWLFKYDNVGVLNIMWITSLIGWFICVGLIVFMTGFVSDKVLLIPGYLLGYLSTIFLGSLIAFLIKNNS
jgi:hypothetical protein